MHAAKLGRRANYLPKSAPCFILSSVTEKQASNVWFIVIAAAALGSVSLIAVRYFGRDSADGAARPRQAGQNASAANKRQGNASPSPPLDFTAPVMGDVPEFSLTDQDHNAFGTSDLRGKVWIANFIFTRCRATCPMQTRRMTVLQEQLTRDPCWPGIRLVSISVDPEHDRPDVLKAYGMTAAADLSQWKFLTGDREEIWRISKEGFHLRVAEDALNSDSPIVHDSKFVLVDRQGRLRGYFDVLGEEGLKDLRQALNFVLPEFVPDDYPEAGKSDSPMTHLAQPPDILFIPWLDERREAQRKSIQDLDSFHDFQFHRAADRAGIDFHPQIVDEQRSRLVVNHYDHGNGVAVADVDGDGRLDIFFVAQVGANGLYLNLGNGKFENITETAGVAVTDRIGVTASFADIDNDGDADLFVTTVRGGNLLLENDGRGVFRDIAAEAGLGYVGHSSAGVFFDYNRDGWLDLFLANVGKYTTDELASVRLDSTTSLPEGDYQYYLGVRDAFAGHLKPELAEQSILYRNVDGKQFVDVSREVGLVDMSWSGDATPCDPNEDGWPDLYVLNMQGDDQFYENVEGQRFERTTSEHFPKTPWGSMGVKSFDFDNDGRFDLLITDMHSDMSQDVGPEREKEKSDIQWPESLLGGAKDKFIFGNAFFRRQGASEQGEPVFQEISDQIGVENYWPWGVSAADFNADGFEDLFIASSMCFPYRYGANSLLLNHGGQRFVDAEFALGVEPRPAGERLKPWFELDCDGADRENPVCRGRSGRVTVWSVLGSRSSVVFDLDEDGDLDIVTHDFNSPPQVLLSDLSEKRRSLNYLLIRLRGVQSNRDGLGAVVTVATSQGACKKPHDGKSGYLAQSRMPLYFGLGDAETAGRIEVAWPSGKKQVMEGPFQANQVLEIVEE
jgi:cytochrome oxidase Cu insertion factor (SCO1/SenC/PrrC family)